MKSIFLKSILSAGLLLALLLAGLAAGCQRRAVSQEPEETPAARVIGVSLPTTQLVYRRAMKELVEQTYGGGDAQLEIRIYDADGSTEQQSQDILKMVDSQVDGIVLVPGSTEDCLPAVEYANEKGVPVITVDNRISDSASAHVISYVGADHYQMGRTAMELLLEILEQSFPDKEQWNVLQLSGIPDTSGTIDRGQGIADVLESSQRICLLGTFDGEFTVENARSVMEDCLRIYPEIDGVICQNDNMAEGCYQALEAAGMAGKIVVVGMDGQSTTLELIQQGGIHGTVLQHPSMILDGITLLCQYLDGQALEPNYYTPITPVTRENAAYCLENDLSW